MNKNWKGQKMRKRKEKTRRLRRTEKTNLRRNYNRGEKKEPV